MNTSTATARALLTRLVACGVREIVISPGSRSAPLTYAAAQLAEAGLLDTYVRIDERDAAFFALGLAKGTRVAGHERPVAVVTTSGTAVANLHPAVLEASYGRVPLLALTADRPARLRATGANQTIDDQSQVLTDLRARFDVPVLGTAVEATSAEAAGESSLDAVVEAAVAAALGISQQGCSGLDRSGPVPPAPSFPGPVQLNVQFDVPLVPEAGDMDPWWPDDLVRDVPTGPVAPGPGTLSAFAALADPDARPVVMAGDTFGHPARRFAGLVEFAGVPVLAEPSSPLVRSSTAIAHHTKVMDARPELLARITDVLVLGKATLFRPDAKLLARSDVRFHVIDTDLDRMSEDTWASIWERGVNTPEWTELRTFGSESNRRRTAWMQEWIEANVAGGSANAAEDAEPDMLAFIREFLTGDGHAYVASSSVVRHLDTVLSEEAASGADVSGNDDTIGLPPVYASRGLAGIDGLISTTLGFAVGTGEPTRLAIGDVAALHDVGGLLVPEEEWVSVPAVQVFVFNDDGGAIFTGLEHGADHLAPYVGRYFVTRHGRTFEKIAQGYGWHHVVVENPDHMRAIIDKGKPGVYEIRLPAVLG